ncbi:MAG: fibronectin type III domain-containing protein [Thermoanaerobaculia bacterium]
MRTKKHLVVVLMVVTVSGVGVLSAWDPLPVKDDPLVRMPGTQPPPEGSVLLDDPDDCMLCHGGPPGGVFPGFNWQGSMMGQAARDFLFFSCLAVAAQDSIWAIGRPNATDICIRCHSPKGWLEGRSDPTNASALIDADWDGVQCDFCHRLYDPFFETTHDGSREGDDWLDYWDETNLSDTPSQEAADATRAADALESEPMETFDGDDFFVDNEPFSPAYDEAGSGQYFVSTDDRKRGPFADVFPPHDKYYSRFHKSKYFCSTCHDVSNPVLANFGADIEQPLPTETSAAYAFLHVERTFSEFMLSAYGQQGGAPGIGPFAPEVFETSYANNYIVKCQDCHLPDVPGTAGSRADTPQPGTDLPEHPQSDKPLHDLTGGNAWVPWILASTVSGSPNYDATNDALLNQGSAVLTLDLTQGLGLDPVALLAGAERARQQLELAAAIEGLSYDRSTGILSFRLQNRTGHKLISGFPEGRRMFVNIRAYRRGRLIYEINPYDHQAGTLKGLRYPYGGGIPTPRPLKVLRETYVDELVYEMHHSSSLTGETETFHFALADDCYKDNRIPPKGFRIAEAGERLVEPVWHGEVTPGYFTAAEYDGGYDEVVLTIPPGASLVEVSLYYQTTSREYVEFLRNEIRGDGNLTLSSPTPSGEPEAYVIQSDPFFSQLKAWGDTLWQLWTHNMHVPGAKPILMTRASVSRAEGCTVPAPRLLSAVPASGDVALTWTDEHTADPSVVGYKVYYTRSAQRRPITVTGLVTTYTDTGLVNGRQYCYKVTAYDETGCESELKTMLCAVPTGEN